MAASMPLTLLAGVSPKLPRAPSRHHGAVAGLPPLGRPATSRHRAPEATATPRATPTVRIGFLIQRRRVQGHRAAAVMRRSTPLPPSRQPGQAHPALPELHHTASSMGAPAAPSSLSLGIVVPLFIALFPVRRFERRTERRRAPGRRARGTASNCSTSATTSRSPEPEPSHCRSPVTSATAPFSPSAGSAAAVADQSGAFASTSLSLLVCSTPGPNFSPRRRGRPSESSLSSSSAVRSGANHSRCGRHPSRLTPEIRARARRLSSSAGGEPLDTILCPRASRFRFVGPASITAVTHPAVPRCARPHPRQRAAAVWVTWATLGLVATGWASPPWATRIVRPSERHGPSAAGAVAWVGNRPSVRCKFFLFLFR
jgi:hypothetical protein